MLRFDPEHDWSESVLYVLNTRKAKVEWLTVASHAEATLLEGRLIEWHRASVGVGPMAYGWEAKQGSPRSAGQHWAQSLWNRRSQARDEDRAEP